MNKHLDELRDMRAFSANDSQKPALDWAIATLDMTAKSNAREGDGVAGLLPIERDEAFDRDYIPLPGGWKIQTKGKGSTFRLCDPDGNRLPIPDSPYLHETLTRMAREVHAAAAAMQAQQGAVAVAWQPIETAPKDGTHVWLGAPLCMRVGFWHCPADGWIDWSLAENGSQRTVYFTPTHWQPLPGAPR